MFVVNPTSGRGRGVRLWDRYGPKGHDTSVLFTQGPGDARRLAAEAAKGGAELVVACGGDGTIGEVAAGLLGSDATLAALPFGTGNDFCRTLGFGVDMEAALAVLSTGRRTTLDAIGWKTETCDGLAINVCGCGFDAMVADRINRGFRMLSGTAAYVGGVLDTLRTFKPMTLKLTIDDEKIEVGAMLCAIANAQSYGGGMKIAPNAAIDDGWLDVIVVQEVGRLEFLKAFRSVFAGTHLNHPRVMSWRARRIVVESQAPVPTLADGELIGQTPVKFEVKPAALTILRP